MQHPVHTWEHSTLAHGQAISALPSRVCEPSLYNCQLSRTRARFVDHSTWANSRSWPCEHKRPLMMCCLCGGGTPDQEAKEVHQGTQEPGDALIAALPPRKAGLTAPNIGPDNSGTLESHQQQHVVVLASQASIASSAFFSACEHSSDHHTHEEAGALPERRSLPSHSLAGTPNEGAGSSGGGPHAPADKHTATVEGLDEEARIALVVREVISLQNDLRVAQVASLLRPFKAGGNPTWSKAQAAGKAQGIDVDHLLEVSERLAEILHQDRSDQGWQKVSDGDLQLLYQHSPSSPSVHSFRARCVLDAPVEHPMCLAREFDLFKEWNKYCIESSFLKESSVVDITAFVRMWLPWPFNNVDMVAEAVGGDMLEEGGCIAVDICSPPEIPPDIKMPSSWGKNMQVRVGPGSFVVFEPLPPASPGQALRSRACVSVHIDAGIKHVPSFLITFLMRVMAPFVYHQAVAVLRKVFSDPHSKLAQRLQQRQDLYPVIAGRIAQHMENQHVENQQRAGRSSAVEAHATL